MSLTRVVKSESEFQTVYRQMAGTVRELALTMPGQPHSDKRYLLSDNSITSIANTLTSKTQYLDVVIDLEKQLYELKQIKLKKDLGKSRIGLSNGRPIFAHRYAYYTTQKECRTSIDNIVKVITDSTKFKSKNITLNLAGNKLNWQHIQDLFYKLKTNTRLAKLHHKIKLQLKDNELDDNAAIEISDFLSGGYCPQGLCLVLNNNLFTEAGLQLLSNALNHPKCPKDAAVIVGDRNLKETMELSTLPEYMQLDISSGRLFSRIFSQKPGIYTTLNFRPANDKEFKICIKTLENQTTAYSTININLNDTKFRSCFYSYYKNFINAVYQNKSSKLNIHISLHRLQLGKNEIQSIFSTLMRQASLHTITVSLAGNDFNDRDAVLFSEYIKRGNFPSNLSIKLGNDNYDLSEQGAQKLLSALKNPAVQGKKLKLSLGGRYISEELSKQIESVSTTRAGTNVFEFFKNSHSITQARDKKEESDDYQEKAAIVVSR